MSKRNWGSGEVLSRKVGANIEELLPPNLATADNVHFTAHGPLRREVRPERAVGGTIDVIGVVGEDSQFKVVLELSMQKRAGSGADPEDLEDWTVWTTFFRSKGTGPGDLDPFQYYVEWHETIGEWAASDSVVVDLHTIGEQYRYGCSDGLATLLLTEIMANRRASAQTSRADRISHSGSLAMMGSFNTALDNGRISGQGWKLDWSQVAELLGPDTESVAARMAVETAVPERQRRAAMKGVDFLADETTDSGRSGLDRTVGQRLSSLLEEIAAMNLREARPASDLATGDVSVTQQRLAGIVRGYPDGFPSALEDGNFGVARNIGKSSDEPYEKMVLIYAFHELYAAIGQLQESDRAVRDIASAITAFGTAIDRGNTDMAQLSLKRASDAFMTVTRELVDGAQSRLESLKGLLAYHDLAEAFDSQVAKREDLTGAELEYYLEATESLVETARRQHERTEKAREAYHFYTKQE
ncbi:MAG: hypothetical protein U5K70_08290 [Halodesulfurarchaeum sp.]|nr:hypothetical protein [Halodesulfurarchaeum sp.]